MNPFEITGDEIAFSNTDNPNWHEVAYTHKKRKKFKKQQPKKPKEGLWKNGKRIK